MPLCLAADNKSKQVAYFNSISKTDTLQTIFNQVSGSQENWEKELSWAYSLGLFLGKKDSIQFQVTHDVYNQTFVLGVVPSKFKQAFQSACESVILKAGEEHSEDAISQLFNKQSIFNMQVPQEDFFSYYEFRKMFSECTHNSVAMLSLDLAILNWVIKAIVDHGEKCLMNVDRNLLMPLSALTMHPQIGEHCTKDVLIVLKCVHERLLASKPSSQTPNYSILITLIKMLDDGVIRKEFEKMATVLFLKENDNYLKSLLLLGPEHSFLKCLEKLLPEEKRTQYENEFHQVLESIIKVHTLGDSSNFLLKHGKHLVISSNYNYLCAIISGDSLEWENTNTMTKVIAVEKEPHLEVSRLFIICRLQLPTTILNQFTSCSSLKEFKEMLTIPLMRQNILTFWVSIEETSLIIQ